MRFFKAMPLKAAPMLGFRAIARQKLSILLMAIDHQASSGK
jgi:hypothetical protein